MKSLFKKVSANIINMYGLRILFIVVMLALWLISIIWVAMDSGKKQISPVFWTYATFVGGPIGLVGYGIVRDLRPLQLGFTISHTVKVG